MHFKQLFLLDGKIEKTNFTKDDEERTHFIVNLLQNWKLLKVKTQLNVPTQNEIIILPFKEKTNWYCKAKYAIGNKNKQYRKKVMI